MGDFAIASGAILARTGIEKVGKAQLMQFFSATPPKKDNVQTKTKRLFCKLNMCEYRYEEHFGLGLGVTTNHVQMYWHFRKPTIRTVFQNVTSHAHDKGISMEMLKKAERNAKDTKLID